MTVIIMMNSNLPSLSVSQSQIVFTNFTPKRAEHTSEFCLLPCGTAATRSCDYQSLFFRLAVPLFRCPPRQRLPPRLTGRNLKQIHLPTAGKIPQLQTTSER